MVCVCKACKGAGLPWQDAERGVEAGRSLSEHPQLPVDMPQRCDGGLTRCTGSSDSRSEAAGHGCGTKGACEAVLGRRKGQSGAVKDRHSDCRSQENLCCRLHILICGFIFRLTSQLSLHMDLAEKH